MKKLALPPQVIAVYILAGCVVIFGSLLVLAPPASAAEPESSCGDAKTSIITCDAAKSGSEEAKDSANNPVIAILTFVMQILTGAVGIAAIGALIYAGILYSAAGGESAQVQKAKTLIKDTVIGLVCYAFMIVILNFFIPGGVFGQQSTVGGGTTNSGGSGGGDGGNPDTTNATSLTLVSWNSFVDNTHDKGAITKSLMGSSDIIGLLEVHRDDQRKDVSKIASSKIGVYVNKDTDAYTGSYPIVYNKSKLTLLESQSGSHKLGNSPDGYRPKYMIYARFRIKDTKQELYFVNTHLLRSVESGGEPSKNTEFVNDYKKMMAKLKTYLRELKSKDVPVFVAGDFAVNYRKDKCKTSWFPCSAMHSLGFKSSYEYTNLSGVGTSYSTYHDGARLIDYVFVLDRSDTTVTDSSVINGGVKCGTNYNCYAGSDHRPASAKIKITTSATR